MMNKLNLIKTTSLRIETIQMYRKTSVYPCLLQYALEMPISRIDNGLKSIKLLKPDLNLASPHDRLSKIRDISLIYQQFKHFFKLVFHVEFPF